MSRGQKVKRRWCQTDVLFPDSDKRLCSEGSTPQEGSPDSRRQHSDMTGVNTPHCHSTHKTRNNRAYFHRGKTIRHVFEFRHCYRFAHNLKKDCTSAREYKQLRVKKADIYRSRSGEMKGFQNFWEWGWMPK